MKCICNNRMNTKTGLLKANRKVLNTAGMRVTNQRALIMEIIRQGQGHLDADEIYRRAREKEPRLSLSTVYRALQMFKKLGLVEELHFDRANSATPVGRLIIPSTLRCSLPTTTCSCN